MSMTEEFFDIVDENDQPLGVIKPRSQVHQALTDWHRVSSIFVINKNDQLLCQQRSWKKDANPGQWQMNVGGHLTAGETYEQNAVRELQEELGITAQPEQLMYIGIHTNIPHKHHGHSFVYEWTGSEPEIKFNDGEVAQVKWMRADEFADLKRQQGMTDFKIREDLAMYLSKRLTQKGGLPI